MYARQNALHEWLKTFYGDTDFTFTPLAGDASFRRYFRLKRHDNAFVVMDAPPDKETTKPFIEICEALKKYKVHTPAIYASDEKQGFILLEDLGDELLLNVLSPHNADLLYKTAINTLLQIQHCPTQCPTGDSTLPEFNKDFMFQEMRLFRDWFLDKYLALQLNSMEEQRLQNTFDWISNEILKQPQVFIHRDYHSRNLIVLNQDTQPELGVIDFQDAMRGPLTYDLVSLLKDCYIQWPREQTLNWVSYFYEHLPTNPYTSLTEFVRAFDLCGLQRHLKVLGIFCRLHLRDNKAAYLRDLPLTFNYVMACLESYDELQPFYQFMQQKIYGPFMEKQQP